MWDLDATAGLVKAAGATGVSTLAEVALESRLRGAADLMRSLGLMRRVKEAVVAELWTGTATGATTADTADATGAAELGAMVDVIAVLMEGAGTAGEGAAVTTKTLADRPRLPPAVGLASPCHMFFSQDGGVSTAAAFLSGSDAFSAAVVSALPGSGDGSASVSSDADAVGDAAGVEKSASAIGEGTRRTADSLWVRRPSSMNGLKTMPLGSGAFEEPEFECDPTPGLHWLLEAETVRKPGQRGQAIRKQPRAVLVSSIRQYNIAQNNRTTVICRSFQSDFN